MGSIRKIASFIRWRLVPVRYATMLGSLRRRGLFESIPPKSAVVEEIIVKGFSVGPRLDPYLLQQAQQIYKPRSVPIIPKKSGHPFVNLFCDEDINPENPVLRYAFSPGVLDAAADYFGGRLILDSIQVLYSYPTEGDLRESQYWHLDYGDRKSFHCVAYLNDVLDPKDGPFVFVDKMTTQKIGRSILIRRIPDQQFSKELMDGKIENFFGVAGSSVLVDPAACYHYGSRCRVPRLAIFATFSTWYPFVQPVPLVSLNAQKLLETVRSIRPDLSESFLKALLQIDS